MRAINKIIVHCSDSDYAHHDNVFAIRHWHIKERGWSDIGYHYIITKNGKIHVGRPIHKKGAHCRRHNPDSIGICLTGKNTFSNEQFKALRELCEDLVCAFGVDMASVYGHKDFDDSKTCPNFNIKDVFI